MPKVHMVASESPLYFNGREWFEALCGDHVPHAKPIFTLNLDDGQMDGVSTIAFCKECLALALSPVSRRTFVYGIAEAQVALDANED